MLAKKLLSPIDIKEKIPENAHILLVRSDHIGDMLLTVPFLRALRQTFPKAEIGFALTPLTAPILKNCPYIDHIFEHNYDDKATLNECVKELNNWRIDLAMAFTQKVRDYELCLKSGAPIRLGRASFSSLYTFMDIPIRTALAYRYLTHIYPEYMKSILVMGQRIPHEIERQQNIAKMLGFSYSDTNTEIFYSDEERAYGNKLRMVWGSPWLTVHLHNKLLTCPIDDSQSSWSEDDLLYMIEQLADMAETRKIAFTYGPVESDLVESASSLLSRLNRTVYKLDGSKELPNSIDAQILFAGNLPFGRWAQILGSGKCLLSADTGAVHVATAQGCPVVDIFPPKDFTRASQGFFPWKTPHAIIAKKDIESTTEEVLRNVKYFTENSRSSR